MSSALPAAGPAGTGTANPVTTGADQETQAQQADLEALRQHVAGVRRARQEALAQARAQAAAEIQRMQDETAALNQRAEQQAAAYEASLETLLADFETELSRAERVATNPYDYPQGTQ